MLESRNKVKCMKKLALVIFTLSISTTFSLEAISSTMSLDGKHVPPQVIQKCAGAKNFFVCIRNEMINN